jgi:hypothetical protein
MWNIHRCDAFDKGCDDEEEEEGIEVMESFRGSFAERVRREGRTPR